MSTTDYLLAETQSAMRAELARVLLWNATVYLQGELRAFPTQRNGASSNPLAHAIADAILTLDAKRLSIGETPCR